MDEEGGGAGRGRAARIGDGSRAPPEGIVGVAGGCGRRGGRGGDEPVLRIPGEAAGGERGHAEGTDRPGGLVAVLVMHRRDARAPLGDCLVLVERVGTMHGSGGVAEIGGEDLGFGGGEAVADLVVGVGAVGGAVQRLGLGGDLAERIVAPGRGEVGVGLPAVELRPQRSGEIPARALAEGVHPVGVGRKSGLAPDRGFPGQHIPVGLPEVGHGVDGAGGRAGQVGGRDVAELPGMGAALRHGHVQGVDGGEAAVGAVAVAGGGFDGGAVLDHDPRVPAQRVARAVEDAGDGRDGAGAAVGIGDRGCKEEFQKIGVLVLIFRILKGTFSNAEVVEIVIERIASPSNFPQN